MYNVQCTMYNVQCTLFNVECSIMMIINMKNININGGDDFGKGKYCERKVL